MAYEAQVWLTRCPGEGRIDLGIVEVEPKPERDAHVSFEYEGKPQPAVIQDRRGLGTDHWQGIP